MAYYNSYGNNYGGYGYPYGGQYPIYPSGYQAAQPQVMPNTQPVQAQQQPVQNYSPVINQSGIIWISGVQEAQMYPIAPNNAVALWEKSGKTIYLKQADATGRPTLTVYDLVERVNETSDSQPSQEGKIADYATKEELGKVVGVVKGVNDLIANMEKDIEAMKGDMYGIAGKKKPVKKAEVEDDT